MSESAAMDRMRGLWEAALGLWEQDFGPRFKAYFVLDVDEPGVSWNLFLGGRLRREDLLATEEHFLRFRPSIAKPFVSLPVLAEFAEPAILGEMGYALENAYICGFTSKRLAPADVGGVEFLSGSFEDAAVFPDYARLTVAAFGPESSAIPELNRRLGAEAGFLPRIVNARVDGRVVGTACVAIAGDIGWLYGAAIDEKSRGKGLWKRLTKERQELSHCLGARTWFLQTEHPHLGKYFEEQVVLRNYRKR